MKATRHISQKHMVDHCLTLSGTHIIRPDQTAIQLQHRLLQTPNIEAAGAAGRRREEGAEGGVDVALRRSDGQEAIIVRKNLGRELVTTD
jgi:hypothetical protein